MYVGENKFVADKVEAVVHDNEELAYEEMSKILNAPETYCSGYYLIDAE